MSDGKIRHPNHIIDSKAIQFIQNSLPSEWVTRQITPDYGIDLDVELFTYEDDSCVTLGEHVFLQVKGTETAQYGKTKLFGKTISDTDKGAYIDVIKFSIDVSLLKLVERMGSSLPVLLIVVDLLAKQAYHVCLNDYIRFVLPEQNPKFKTQKNVTIYIPVENKISDMVFKWYGKRSKIYSLFQEIHTVADNCLYATSSEIITNIQQLINRIINHDAWNAREYVGYMEVQYKRLIEMFENDLITAESKEFVQLCTEDRDNWKDVIFFAGAEERPTKGSIYAQEISCKKFLETASGMASYYDGVLRHLWLPTTTSKFLSEI